MAASAYFKNGSLIENLLATATSGGTLVLTNTSEAYQVFTGTLNHIVKLPVGTTLVKNQKFEILNFSSGAITVQDSTSAVLTTLSAGTSAVIHITDITTSAGVFDIAAGVAGAAGGLTSVESGEFTALKSKGFSTASALLKYNPEAIGGNFWTAKAALPAVNAFSGQATLNGFFYDLGGWTPYTNTNNRFDQDNNYWINRALVTNPKGSAAAFTLAEAYFFGGQNTSGANSDHYSYNDLNNAWTTRASLPVVTDSPAGFALSGFGFMVGGRQFPSVVIVNNVYMYNSTTDTWYSKTGMIQATWQNGGCDLNGIGYSVGALISSSQSALVQSYNIVTNSWSGSIASLNTARSQPFVCNALGNLIASGGGSNGVTNNEKYSDTSNIWLVIASLPTATTGNTGGQVNGFPIVAGGYAGGATGIANNQVYSPVSLLSMGILTKTQVAPSSMQVAAILNNLVSSVPVQVRSDGDKWTTFMSGGSPLKLSELIANKFVERGQVYAAGGDNGSSDLTANEAFNELQNVWIVRQSLPNNINTQAGFRVGGLGYLAGGNQGGGAYITTIYAFNDLLNSISAKTGVLSQARASAVGSQLNGFGYVIGGTNGNAVATVDRYNPTTDSAASITAISTALAGSIAWNLGNRVYCITGANGSGSSANGVTTSQRYDDILSTWTAIAAATAKAYGGGFAINGFGYSLAGNNPTQTTSAFKYDPAANSWSSITAVPYAPSGPGAARGGSFGYIFGGYNGGAYSTTYQYNDANQVYTSMSGLNTAREGIAAADFSPGVSHDYEVRIGIPALFESLGSFNWITRTNLTTARSGAQAGKLLGQSVVSGGGASASTEVFTDALNAWLLSAPTPVHNGGAAGFVLSSLLYNCTGGGGDATSRYYDHNLKTWTSIASVNSARGAFPRGSVLNGFGYVLGGNNGTSNLPSAEQYSQSANTWTTKASMSGSSVCYVGLASAAGQLYTFGGFDNNTNALTNVAQTYNDAANAWSSKTSLAANLFSAFANKIHDSNILISGGETAISSFTAAAYEYSTASDSYAVRVSIPTAKASHTFDGTTDAGGNNGSDLANASQFVDSIKNAVLSAGLVLT